MRALPAVVTITCLALNAVAAEPAALLREVSVMNATKRSIIVVPFLYVGPPGNDRTSEQIALGRGEQLGKTGEPFVIGPGRRATVSVLSLLPKGHPAPKEPGDYVYWFQAYYGDAKLRTRWTSATPVDSKGFRRDELAAVNGTVTIEPNEQADRYEATIDEEAAVRARAADPRQLGTLTIRNWRGEKLYCRLHVPTSDRGGTSIKRDFVLEAKMGASHSVPKLRLFAGYRLWVALTKEELENGGPLIKHEGSSNGIQMEPKKEIDIGSAPE